MRLSLALLAFLLVIAAPARAEEAETPPPHTDEQMEEHQVIETFESKMESDDIDDQIMAVRSLGRWRHKEVVKVLSKIFQKSKELELRSEAAKGLGNQLPFAKTAGKALYKGLLTMKKWASREDPEGDEEVTQKLEAQVVVCALQAIGALGWKDGWKELKDFIDHGDDDIAAAMMLQAGQLKEYRALKVLLEWFNFYPTGYSWAGGSVRVDTGAAGNKDANAAKAKWKAKFGGRARKARPNAWNSMIEALEMITGVKFEKSEELKEWMKANKALLRRNGA